MRRLRVPRPAQVGVGLVLVMAGLLFAATAQTARGTQLRSDGQDDVNLVRSEDARNQGRQKQVDELRRQVQESTTEVSAGNSTVAALQAQADLIAPSAGLSAVDGPGVVVTLDDAPHTGSMPPGATANDLVIHQGDVQAVVNALWAGGAESMMLMDQRVISTSAVRCVGNTLILQGRVYSPPYRVAAIGDPATLRRALDADVKVTIFQEYVRAFRLGWNVQSQTDLVMPAFSGTLDLRYARVAP